MGDLDAIFNPGAAAMDDHLASEKLLPAPAPIAGAPLNADDNDEVIIPKLTDLATAPLPEPVRVVRKQTD